MINEIVKMLTEWRSRADSFDPLDATVDPAREALFRCADELEAIVDSTRGLRRDEWQLASAMRERARRITGAEWERNATSAMLLEAADLLEDGCVKLLARNQVKRKASLTVEFKQPITSPKTKFGGLSGETPFYLFEGQQEPEYDQGDAVIVWYDDLYDLTARNGSK